MKRKRIEFFTDQAAGAAKLEELLCREGTVPGREGHASDPLSLSHRCVAAELHAARWQSGSTLEAGTQCPEAAASSPLENNEAADSAVAGSREQGGAAPETAPSSAKPAAELERAQSALRELDEYTSGLEERYKFAVVQLRTVCEQARAFAPVRTLCDSLLDALRQAGLA